MGLKIALSAPKEKQQKESVGRKLILNGGSDKAVTPNKQYPTPYDWARSRAVRTINRVM